MNAALEGIPPLPDSISGLASIALNLAWSWNRDARELFARIDPTVWSRTRDNPVRLLQEVDPARLASCASDPEFVALYDTVLAAMKGLESDDGTWFVQNHATPEGPVAYFCAEFAVHDSIPIYSGGLGILAGDHVKSASDLGVPLVGVGLLYSRGYFDQSFDAEGWQINKDEVFDPSVLPLTRLHEDEERGLVSVKLYGREVALGAWSMRVGRSTIYLLDADLAGNDDRDRQLTGHLYGAGDELRLKQEWILGVGGVRVLDALGVEPAAWHANEGHAAFMMVERARRLMERSGGSFADAVAQTRANSVFTTHTPVPAGHDNFTTRQIENVLGPVWTSLGLERDEFMAIGFAPETGPDRFHMTATAIRLARGVNGVSKKHGRVTREIWSGLWKDRSPDEVPIGSVTNGVHRWTWMSPEIQTLLDQELGEWWTHRVDEPELWDRVLDIDDTLLWELHQRLKRQSFRFLTEEARRRWRDVWGKARHLVASGPLLDPEVLTLGFARRFATYKRADLLLRQEERLLDMITDERRPVQIVFAGKAHPADDAGKRILQRIYRLSHDARSAGRVAFVQDYEMHVARALFAGVDVWLNVPRVPKEASGTSGMKAALNLVPQLGTRDGWWAEGYTGDNGWMIPAAPDPEDPDEWDWDQLFLLLENEVVPTYHDRGRDGIPRSWARIMKHALWIAGRDFTTDRMLRDYTDRYYGPAWTASLEGDDPPDR
jgi:starch phosphorylase